MNLKYSLLSLQRSNLYKHLRNSRTMEIYTPRIIELNPERIIPYHETIERNERMVLSYLRKEFVPPVPVIRAPESMKTWGNYINYNGHHRTEAAKRVSELLGEFKFSCILLDCWEDIDYLIKNPPRYRGEVYPELIEYLGDSFEEHKNFIINQAERYIQFKKRKEEKNNK